MAIMIDSHHEATLNKKFQKEIGIPKLYEDMPRNLLESVRR